MAYPKNDPDDDMEASDQFKVTTMELNQFLERIERLDEERQQLTEDISEVYAEAKARGFDTKVMRAIVARRKKKRKDSTALSEFEAIFDHYLEVLGDL